MNNGTVKWAALLAATAYLAGCKADGIKYNTFVVEERTVETTVTATGYLQPVDKVDVGTQVSGVIEKIFVDFNSPVKKGQLLAEIDKSTLNEKLAQARAMVTSAQSDLTFAQQNYDRTKKLFEAKAATQAAWEQAENSLAQARTSLSNSQANLHQAQVNLSYAEIYSPIDGVVLNRAVDQGQTVAASFSTPTLFTIAKDLTRMKVEANVDEADIGRVETGQEVRFTVDSYPDDTFGGKVVQVRLQPAVTSNVVTYTVIIEAPNPEEKLFPGMTASVAIITDRQSGLVTMAEALHFRPKSYMVKGAVPSEDSLANGVWVETAEGIEYRHVNKGLSDGVYTVVEEGLAADDKTVLSVASLTGGKDEKEKVSMKVQTR